MGYIFLFYLHELNSSRDVSPQAKIRATKPLSRDPSHQAELSCVLSFILLPNLRFHENYTLSLREMLRNKFYYISHCLDVFIIIYSYPINWIPHKYCKHTEKILINM